MVNKREKERKEFVKRCLREYYEEDKEIIIDSSICRIYAAQYIIKDLIYFGNKIIIPNEDVKILKKFAAVSDGSGWEKIRGRNAISILKMLTDKSDIKKRNIKIISFPNKVEDIARYLQEESNSMFYLQNEKLFYELCDKGLRKELYMMYEGMEDIGIFKSKYSFETIGAIRFMNEKMLITPRENSESEIEVYTPKGIKREGVEVKQKDLILIKSFANDGVKSIRLYEIVSKHSRNHASLILWTKLKEDEKSNKYIQALPYNFQRVIENN